MKTILGNAWIVLKEYQEEVAPTTKEIIIKEVELMSEVELAKVLRLLHTFGLTKHKPTRANTIYPLRGLPVQYIDPMQPTFPDKNI